MAVTRPTMDIAHAVRVPARPPNCVVQQHTVGHRGNPDPRPGLQVASSITGCGHPWPRSNLRGFEQGQANDGRYSCR